VPKRILVLNGPIGVNRVALGLARVRLEGAPASAFQITGVNESGGENYFGENIFSIDQRDRSSFEFVVQRVGETTGPATVKFATSDGSAHSGVDYVAQTGTLNFAPLETEKLLQVPLIALTNRESRVFFLSLSEPSGANLSGQPPIPVMILGKAQPP